MGAELCLLQRFVPPPHRHSHTPSPVKLWWPFVLVLSADRKQQLGGWYLPLSDALTKRAVVGGGGGSKNDFNSGPATRAIRASLSTPLPLTFI